MRKKYKYLEWMEKNLIVPNFFISEEYFNKSELEETIYDDGTVEIWDNNDQLVFPPLDENWFREPRRHNEIWSDFVTFWPQRSSEWEMEFLDYQFTYDPREFLTMKGGDWQVFRKNCRKFPRRYPSKLWYEPIEPCIVQWGAKHIQGELIDLLIKWLEHTKQMIHDEHLIEKYLLEGENRYILTNDDGRILGINIFDENYFFINFRYCFHDPEYDFLSEYMRYLFYTHKRTIRSDKLVNDGGALGQDSLRDFKLKMNPVGMTSIFTWKRKEHE